MAVTKLENLVNPEVVADTITAELDKAIKFSPVAVVDKTLEGVAGNTISVPQYAYVGDADDVVEGGAITPTLLTATTVKATVKKAAKSIEITDEAMLSGTGSPLDEASRQLSMSIGSKVDNDIMDAMLEKNDGEYRATKVGSASTAFSLTLLSSALDTFEDEALGERKFLFVNPVHMGVLRTDPTFTHASELGDNTLITGAVGTVYGCEVIPTRKIVNDPTDKFICILAKEGAVSLYLKRDVNVETGRDITHKTTVISADEHYVAKMRDASKVVLIQNKGV